MPRKYLDTAEIFKKNHYEKKNYRNKTVSFTVG